MKRYTSDLHINHKNILEYDSRPFSSIEEHDQAIIDNLNIHVKRNDELYILWDIVWKFNNNVLNLLKTIKCTNIFFIIGNHDFPRFTKKFVNQLWWHDLWLMHQDKDDKLILCHYPMEEWYHGRHKDPDTYIHIHWHSHWNSRIINNRIDVWLTYKDITRPMRLVDIKEIIQNRLVLS